MGKLMLKNFDLVGPGSARVTSTKKNKPLVGEGRKCKHCKGTGCLKDHFRHEYMECFYCDGFGRSTDQPASDQD